MKKILLVIPLLLAIPLVSAAENETGNVTSKILTPGTNLTYQCTAVNETVKVECLESCPICYVNRSGSNGLEPNEKYVFNQGACNLDLYCMPSNETGPEGVVEFPSVLSMRKDNTTFLVQYTVWDHLGAVYLNRSWDIQEMDALRMDVDTGFTCPSEIVSEINFATCSKYLDKHLQTSDPLLLSMVTGTNTATQELVKCQSELNSKITLADRWQSNHDQIMDDYQRCNSESINKTNEINRLNANTIKLQQVTVPASNQTILIFVIIGLLVMLGIAFDIIPLGWR